MLSRLSEVRRPSAPDSQIAGGLPSAAPVAPTPRLQIAGGLPSAAPAHVGSGWRPSAPDSQIAGGLPSAAPAAPSPRVQIAGGLPSAAPAHVDSGSQTTRRQHLDAQVWEDERPKVPIGLAWA